MKKLSIFLLTLCLLNTAYTQTAYYDALKIDSFNTSLVNNTVTIKIDSSTALMADSILKYYIDSSAAKNAKNKQALFQEIAKAFRDNPFLKISGQVENNRSLDFLKGQQSSFSVSSALSAFGNLNVANVADGLAKFLIKRGKEELNIAFFTRMKNFLDDPAHPECKTLFPATTAMLENILSYQYAEFIQSLREAFQSDLANLIVNLNQLIDLPKFQLLLKNLPEIRIAIRSAKIVSELSQSATYKPLNPAVVIDHLAGLAEWQDIHPNLAGSWKLLNVISQSVLNNEGDHIWVTLGELNGLVNDSIKLRIFLGLLYQKTAGIEFVNGTEKISVQTFLTKNAGNIYTVSNLVENFALLANDIDRTIADLKDKNGPLTDDDFYSYIGKAINITEYGFTIANQVKPGVANNEYIVMARNANDLYKSIYSKNYSVAAMNLYNILDKIFVHAKDLAKEKITRKSLVAADSVNLVQAVSNNSFPDQKLVNGILKYGNFLASIVKAESSDEVQNAIEAAALPAGSYSIKQKAVFNISLNGYIGYAWDFGHGSGVYAPLGFTFATRLTKIGGSVGVFISLIDVGSVASYRLSNGTTDSLKQQIRLESIFSPGAQLMIGIPKTPIALFGGWRLTPKQFYSKQDGFTVIDHKSAFNAGIVIDIPITTIFNKSHLDN